MPVLLAFVAASLTPLDPAAARFRVRYEYGQTRSRLTLVDFQFPSPKRGIAVGFTEEKAKEKGIILLSSDAGASWTTQPFSQIPISIFFLDDTVGWMVTEKGIWKTLESGRNWQKLPSSPKQTLRVWFQTEQRGWAIGVHKQMMLTEDGGANWAAVPEAGQAQGTPEITTFGAISFADKNKGLVTGWSTPRARPQEAVPDWADPEEAQWRSDVPSLSIFLETRNGGKTWTPTASSLFGRMTRTFLGAGNRGLGLIEFSNHFEWPAEVYLFDLRNGKPTRVFRERNRVITDVLVEPDGSGYLAGYEALGAVRRSPIPGPVKVLYSKDLVRWEEVPVDYRAEAHRCMISSPDPEHVWVATDTGMILSLEPVSKPLPPK